MVLSRVLFILICLSAPLATTNSLLAGSPKYSVVDLGPVDSGPAFSPCINNVGQVADSLNGTAVLLAEGKVPVPLQGGANSINDSGQGTQSPNTITPLPGYNAGILSVDRINNSGQEIGSGIRNSKSYSFIYSGGVVTDLGLIAPWSYGTAAYAINNLGHITGSVQWSTQNAMLYANGTLTDLWQGYYTSVGYDINDNDQITGFATFDPNSQTEHAFLYTGGTFKDLGTLGGAQATLYGAQSWGFAINNSGDVVGMSETLPYSQLIPFLYTGGIMYDLTTLIDPALHITNLSVSNSYAIPYHTINNSGQIAATGTINGATHALLLKPIPSVTVGLRSDLNGDHQIDFSSTSLDTTTSTAPFRFWLNDDHDTGDQTDGNDLNDGVADNADMIISSIRDLEDFAPLNLYLPSSVASSLHQGAKIVFSVTGTGSLHLVPISQPGFAYLYDPVYARSLTPLPGIGVSPVTMYTASAAATVSVPLDQLFSNPQTGDRTLGFIFEGVSAGDLVLSGQIIDANGSVVAQTENFYLHLGEITEFYNHFTVGNSEAMNAPVATTATELNPNAPDSTNPNVPYILFVHGWRLHTWERVKFAETAFKRLFQAGYRGEFGMFSWPTEWVDIPDSYYEKLSIFSSLANRGNYDRSELQAWKSATGLRNLIDSQLESGSQPRVRILAHSMGNVVASEALKLGLNKTGSKKVYSYIASQAATVASAYDVTVPNVSGDGLAAYPGSDIYRQWPLNSYKNYFLGIHGMSASGIFSFCNPSDYALSSIFSWPSNQSLKPDVGYAYLLGSQQYAVYDANGQANPIPYGVIPDSYTAFAFAAPASSNALGAEPLTGGEIYGTVRLDSYPTHYTDAKTDHSAEFLSTIQYQHYYWEDVLGYSGIGTIPPNPATTQPSSFQNWSLMWFGFSGTDTTSQASFTGDGVSNLTKYAFGLNPLQPGGVPQVTISKAQGQVQIEFWCRANLTDVSYAVEQSGDLKTWSTAAVSLSVVSSSGPLQLVSGVVPEGGATQQFYRVRVSLTQ